MSKMDELNEKLVYLQRTKVLLKEAIVAKGGTIADDAEFRDYVDAVEGISGTSVPDGTNVTFGNEKKTVTITTPEGKAYFNGVILPEIPADILAEYPYAWIRNNTTSGYYDLLLCQTQRYYNSGIYPDDAKKWYRIEIANATSAEEWVFYEDNNNYFGLDDNRTVLWSNHDIPDGSTTATDIYFKGSEPVTELVETGSFPADRLEAYAILGADLNALGAITQKMAGKSALMTVADMIYWLNRVQYIPQGNAESKFTLNFEPNAE